VTDIEKPITKLLAIIEIGSASTGLVLFNKIKHELILHDDEVKNNFIGFCTDNESKMISTKVSGLDSKTKALVIKGQGLSNRLMKEVRHLIHIGDLCHLYNLVCEKAIGELPTFIIEFIKQICSYFDKGLRDNRLREIRSETGVKKPISILGFIKIR